MYDVSAQGVDERMISVHYDDDYYYGKRSRSFCQKCRWQVTAKHACTLRIFILHEVT